MIQTIHAPNLYKNRKRSRADDGMVKGESHAIPLFTPAFGDKLGAL
jgi:hypothetical protein